MCQANWISLGIIVTLLVCMVQRFASSKSKTRYASAASCRHKTAHAWKCISYLSTIWAILWTSCTKGHFLMRSSMPFWNQQILQRATVPGQYLWGFFTCPGCKNSFLGALPPTVGQSLLRSGSFSPNVDGMASSAIWANCWVGINDSNLPMSSNCSASTTHLVTSARSGGASFAGMGGFTGEGGCFSSSLAWALVLTCSLLSPPSLA